MMFTPAAHATLTSIIRHYLDARRSHRCCQFNAANPPISSRQLAPYIEAEIAPGPSASTDDELLDFARRNASTAYHLSGTCKMGTANDPTAVVDEQLRVIGV